MKERVQFGLTEAQGKAKAKSFHVGWSPASGGQIAMIDATAKVPTGQLTGNQVGILLTFVANQINRALTKATAELKTEGFTVLDTSNVTPQFDVTLTQDKSKDMVLYAQGSILIAGKKFAGGSEDKATKIIGGALADEGYRMSRKPVLK
jgi:hypothetical protein